MNDSMVLTTTDDTADCQNSDRFISQKALAKRWDKSARTLEAWRQRGTGPAYVKLGRAVRYPLAAIEAYEAANLKGTPPTIGGDDQR